MLNVEAQANFDIASSHLKIHMQNNLSSTIGNYSTALKKRAWQPSGVWLPL